LENFQTHLLQQLDYIKLNFSVIGISETKIRDDKFSDFNPDIANYRFEFVPTPLASGGVGLYIRNDLNLFELN
jgi:exonuclease III